MRSSPAGTDAGGTRHGRRLGARSEQQPTRPPAQLSVGLEKSAALTQTQKHRNPMKRLTTLAAMLLTLAAVPLALAAGGPGKFETKLTGNAANTEHGALDGTWTIDLANPHRRAPAAHRQRSSERRRQVRDLGLHHHPHAQEGRPLQGPGQVQVQAERQHTHVHSHQRHVHGPQGRPHPRPVDKDRLTRLDTARFLA